MTSSQYLIEIKKKNSKKEIYDLIHQSAKDSDIHHTIHSTILAAAKKQYIVIDYNKLRLIN